MIFGPTPLDEARGAVLAHSVRLPGKVIKKGTVLDQAAIGALQTAGRGSVTPENQRQSRSMWRARRCSFCW